MVALMPFFAFKMNLIDKYNEANLYGKANNLKLKVISKGHIEYRMQIEDQHLALPEVVHGGAIAGFMDAILSVAAFTATAEDNMGVATVEFKINYLKAVKKTGELLGVGKVIKHGKRILISQGEIFDQSGDLVAVGTGSIIPVQFEG